MLRLKQSIRPPLALLFMLLSFKPGNCDEYANCRGPLGMQSGAIPDSAITASSSYEVETVGAKFARIRTEEGGGAWCPRHQIAPGVYEYLQMDLQSLHVITSVETQGRFGNGQGQEYMDKYLLEYKREEDGPWTRYRDENGPKIFRGNTNTYLAEQREVDPPIIARKIRFIPYSDKPSTVCTRVELYGCPWEANCRSPLGMQSGAIPDSAITASSSFEMETVGAKFARIRTEEKGGAWCPRHQIAPNVYEYLQIDLQSLHVITSVETQGRFGNGQGQEYMDKYLLEYKREEDEPWTKYRDEKGPKIFQGNTNTYLAEQREVDPPIIARKIRFVPYSDKPSTVCTRVELYGCPSEANCRSPLGMQSGAIPDSAITASSSYEVETVGAKFARIRTEEKGGAWCPRHQIAPNVYEYLQIDLQSLHVITSVETQGRFG
ncbi:venom prothrombin activator pseutarin-C non-catalytic subunit, partial [Lingula anatina]|uniref:Venom prothrombin activator pseutarin-C non-catalytic subunit n=1 Tax=Lingula anatina TaxID=7574 RepID=A0A1S3IN88_LINAN